MSHNLLESLLGETATGGTELPAKVDADTLLRATGDSTVDVADGSSLTEEELLALEESGMVQLAESQELLAEQMNIVRLNKQARLSNLTTRGALILSRRANDTLWTQYAKFNGLRIRIRDQIVKKYGSKASAYARNVLTSVAGKK